MHLCISSLAVLWLSGAALAVAQPDPAPTKVPEATGAPIPRRTLHLEKADLSSAFDTFQELSGRTVLSSTVLRATTITVNSGGAVPVSESLRILEEALIANGCVVQTRGEKFVFVVPARQAQTLSAIANPPPPSTNVPPSKGFDGEIIPPGMIKFQEARAAQVLSVYSDLTGREILSSAMLLPDPISVKNQTSLSREEAAWMLQAVLRLGNVAIIQESDRFVFAVPPSQTNDLPHYDPAAAAAKARRDLVPGRFSLRSGDAHGLLAPYARVSGRKAIPAETVIPKASIHFQSWQELKPGEMIFVMEALAALNGLEFYFPDQNHVGLQGINDRR
jgi:type II secretory pathway component GspD/PulD (secretin)